MGWYCLILSSFSMSSTAPFSTALILSSADSLTPTAARRAPAPRAPAVLLNLLCLPSCLPPPDPPPEAASPWVATARLARLEVVQARRVRVPLNIMSISTTDHISISAVCRCKGPEKTRERVARLPVLPTVRLCGCLWTGWPLLATGRWEGGSYC